MTTPPSVGRYAGRGLNRRIADSVRRRAFVVLRNIVAPSRLVGPRLRRRLYCWGGLTVGRETRIAEGLRLTNERVVIGERCFVNSGCHVDPGDARVLIGDDVNIGAAVILAAADHEIGPARRRAEGSRSAEIRIGNGAWIGARVVVLAGVEIADGCIVGAGAVVTKSTTPNGVYAGVPAERVRDLDR